VPFGVADIEPIDEPLLLVGQESELGPQAGAKGRQGLGRIYADGENVDTGLSDFPVEPLELTQLRRAEGSPASPKEEIEGGAQALHASRMEELALGIGKRDVGKTIPDLECQLPPGKDRAPVHIPSQP